LKGAPRLSVDGDHSRGRPRTPASRAIQRNGWTGKDPNLRVSNNTHLLFKHRQSCGFADWRLSVDGMVARPTSFSRSDLRGFPVRSQITEVVCEEGWSYVAEWIGKPLQEILNASGILPQARYFVYYSISMRVPPLSRSGWGF